MATVEEVLKLAESLKGVLREGQLERIQNVVPKVGEEQLQKLHGKLMELEKIHIKSMKHEIEVRQKVNAAYKAHQAKEKTVALKTAESQERAAAEAEAARLLEELNQL